MSPRRIRRKILFGRKPPRILIVRNDGIGDFLLTLPMIASIKKQVPEARIHVLIHSNNQLLVPMLSDIEGAVIDAGVLLRRHRRKFRSAERMRIEKELELELRAYSFDLAILPYAEARSARLIHRAGIPVRIGPGRRHFFWRFNVRHNHSRRKSNRSEYSLNLAYLSHLGLKGDFARPSLRESYFRGEGGPGRKKYAVLHPYKKSGTALTWPGEKFAQLAKRLQKAGFRVIAIGDTEDREDVEAIFSEIKEVEIETGLSLRGLARLLRGAKIFAGNSSGPIHLAALMQTPHVGFFPQNKASSPLRWKTIPIDEAPRFRDVLLTSSFDKDCIVCEGEKCPYHNCVDSISVDDAAGAVEKWGIGLQPRKPATRKKAKKTKKKR